MLAVPIDLLRRGVEVEFGAAVSQVVDASTMLAVALPSTGGGSFNTSVQRLSGDGNGTSWSVVIKHLSGDDTRPDWDREASVYADAEWLQTALPPPLRAPRLLASAQADHGITFVFEDLPSAGPMSIRDAASAAHSLSEFNGGEATPRPWWSTDFLDREFRALANHPDRLAEQRHDASLEQLRRQLVLLTAEAPDHLATVASLSPGPAHLDAYSRNLMFSPADHQIGLVDWANAGSAPLGTDPATLFVLSLDHLDVDAASILELEQSITAGMHAGLASKGASVFDANAGFRAASRLRHLAMMMNALPMVERNDPAVSEIIGRPLDEIIDQWLTVGDHLLS